MPHQVKDATIRLRTNDGVWESCGVDRSRGISHENLQLEWDEWGPSSATFDLRRSPRSVWPDIAAYSDVEIEISGVQVWKGRVKATPSRDSADRALSVTCEGLQAHLDDDCYVPLYVHTHLADWKDQRSFTDAVLGSSGGNLSAGWQVQSGDQAISIVKPAGFNPGSWTAAAVVLDAGPACKFRKLAMICDVSNWTATSTLYVAYSNDRVNWTATYSLTLNFGAATGVSTVVDFGSGNEARYIRVLVDSNSTPSVDEWVKLTSLIAFTDASYESGGASALKASTVVLDALSEATILLDTDRSLITATTFSIPELAQFEDRTPREVWAAVNAFHNWRAKIDERGRPVFSALPTVPRVKVGEWTAMEGTDASMNSGENIFSQARVIAKSPDGQLVRVTRTQAQQAGVPLIAVAPPAFTNDSFTTNTTGWSLVGTGSIVRDTVTFQTSPASLRATGAAVGQIRGTLTGTFQAGTTYVFEFYAKGGSATAYASVGIVGIGPLASIVMNTTFQKFRMTWTPNVNVTNPVFYFERNSTGPDYYLDSFTISKAIPTLVDRRGFRRTKRLPIDAVLPPDGVAAAQICDAFLATHKLAQFKGEFAITGPVREVQTDKSVPPEQLGMLTTELLRFDDRVDPDTGATGREGRIAKVTYTLADDTARVSIDNTSANFEALLARLGAIQGAR